MFHFCVLFAVCYGVTLVKLLHYWHIIVGETYFVGEELHEIVQNSSNEEYRENKQSDGSNVERDKEGDETEESAVQGDVDGRKNKKLPLLHVQSIRIFHISLEQSGVKKHLLLWKGNCGNFKSGPTIYQ